MDPNSWTGPFLATHFERKSSYVCVAKLANKRADVFTAGTIRVLQAFPPSLRRTLSADNGVEFAQFKRLETALGLKVYVAHPYSAWERGSNENTNGLLRVKGSSHLLYNKRLGLSI